MLYCLHYLSKRDDDVASVVMVVTSKGYSKQLLAAQLRNFGDRVLVLSASCGAAN